MNGLTPPPKLNPWNAGSIARGAEPAEPHARAEDLGEGARADDAARAIQRVDGWLGVALEPELVVGVVLQNEGVVLLGEPDQLLAAPDRQIGPGRVLKVDDGVDQLAPAALAADFLEALADGARDHAVFVHRHAEDLGAVPADVVERAGERRRLDDDRIARVHEGAERERERGARAIRDEDVLGGHLEILEEPVLVADQLAQA